MKRTHYCGVISKENKGENVIVAGWIHGRRDHGGLIFIDLRDRSGIVQVVFDFQKNATFFEQARKLRQEHVIAVAGEIVLRSPDTVNPGLFTGEIEIAAAEMELLNASQTPPFYIEDGIDTDENLRLQYRYLDLRRPEMQEMLRLRHRTLMSARKHLDGRGFLEVETPMLTRSTPEGARDYLVPSRTFPGHFFALPQSPQLFKQLLMVAGVDKYFQIARCFRDEDLRADRQPEFTQIDMEMSFCSRDDIIQEVEGLVSSIFDDVLERPLDNPFKVLPYVEAMERFGSDKPDTRFGMEIGDISSVAAASEFKVFKNMVQDGGVVKGLNVKGCAHFSRKDLDDLTSLARTLGTGGLAWMALVEDGIKTPIAKFFTSAQLESIKEKMKAEPGDLLLFVADKWETALKVLGQLRLDLAQSLDLVPEGTDHFLWVVDFPLLAYDQKEGRYVSNHHPFTAPHDDDYELLSKEPLKARSQAYDLVYNGTEIAGGSIRIHRRALQEEVFRLLDIGPEEAKEKFGFLLKAFQYGAPPHGGIAFGLDRLVMLMAARKSIRDVIPFPKTAAGTCLLTGAPAGVSAEQLAELHISTIKRNNNNGKG